MPFEAYIAMYSYLTSFYLQTRYSQYYACRALSFGPFLYPMLKRNALILNVFYNEDLVDG
jgi:hypothetical protein